MLRYFSDFINALNIDYIAQSKGIFFKTTFLKEQL